MYTALMPSELTPVEYKLFRYHFLLGADWNLCRRYLKIDKATFDATVERIQRKLGRVVSVAPTDAGDNRYVA